MAVVKYNNEEIALLARLMRAEAEGDGKMGMLLVGYVGINRVRGNCLDFKNINTIEAAIFQKGQFEGTKISLFNARATTTEKNLALKAINSWRQDPAYNALFFQNPGKGKPCKNRFWGTFSGRYKNHCFYNPDNIKVCKL